MGMKKITYQFSTSSTDFYFDSPFDQLNRLVGKDNGVIITDENVFSKHRSKFKGWNTIVLKPGEQYKIQATVDNIIDQLLEFQADRKTILIGVGGGVVTDITGYVAAIYMRGLRFGFVPTSILAMVDAAIGGKNGIDVGLYKNMVGTIRQPAFLLYSYSLLSSLPKKEWINGFAEIIKHAAIKEAGMFKLLEQYSLKQFQLNKKLLSALIEANVKIKASVVQNDEFEQGERKLLNFGHTLGHAVENLYELSHGAAIAIGMTVASQLSEQISGLKETNRVIDLLNKYGLPTHAQYDKKKVFEILKMDKKKVKQEMNYVLLEKIGRGVVKSIPLKQLEKLLQDL
jgi:3-dehydroquinate synthase